MSEKLIIEWLHRVLEEKTSDVMKIQERISIINHQIQHLCGMNKIYQRQVIEDLIKDVEYYECNSEMNWDVALKQLKEVKERI